MGEHHDTTERTGGLLTEIEPERYARIQIEQTAKGFRYETTVSIRGCLPLDQIDRELTDLNLVAAHAAQREIEARSPLERRAVNGVASQVETAPNADSIDSLPF